MSDRAAWAVTYVATRKELERVAKERIDLLSRERAARAEAEVANRAKDDFLATVSHELRTPLNAILGWTVTARRKSPPPQIDRALSIIERNARAQARIIEDVLDISRIISGRLRLEMVATNVAEAIAGAVETVRPGAEGKGVELAVDVVDVGAIAGDADRIQQVVWNVLSNAIKFTPAGGKVSVSATRDASHVIVSVSDSGQGIEPAFLPHLFEPFRQADASTTRRHGGLGLGLAIVKEIVQAHGGTIRAESAGVGKGATFIIELPARGTARPAAAEASVAQPAELPRLDELSLLVVDDDPDARHLLKEILSSRGARVACASSAKEALACIGAFLPDVLVSDIGMPEMDGFAFIQEVRRLPPDRGGWTPAIALTAYTRNEDGRRAFASGFQTLLAKPVEPSYLVAAVANLATGAAARSHEGGPVANGAARSSSAPPASDAESGPPGTSTPRERRRA
jgi:CheY-like chemotaxis protein